MLKLSFLILHCTALLSRVWANPGCPLSSFSQGFISSVPNIMYDYFVHAFKSSPRKRESAGWPCGKWVLKWNLSYKGTCWQYGMVTGGETSVEHMLVVYQTLPSIFIFIFESQQWHIPDTTFTVFARRRSCCNSSPMASATNKSIRPL
jgi:hypothetical protein